MLLLRRATSLRRAAAALRTHKPTPTHVTTVGVDGASVGILIPEQTIVPKLGEILCPETLCKPMINVDDLNQKVITYSSGIIIPALSVAPLTASISPLSIKTGLVGSSSLLEFGGALPTASIKASYIPPSIITSLPVAATLNSSYDGQSSSWRPPSKVLAVLVALGVVGTLGEIQPDAACVNTCRGQPGIVTPCECMMRKLVEDDDVPENWDDQCGARVTSGQKHGVVVPRYGVSRFCQNYINFPNLFLPKDVLGGVRTNFHTMSGKPREDYVRKKTDQERYSAFTPFPLLKEIMKDVDRGYPRVEQLFEVVFRHSDILQTILPIRGDTEAMLDAKAHYKELLAAKIRGEDVLCLDIERVQTTLTTAMRARKDPKGEVIANEATQVGAVVGRLRPDLGKGDVEVILNEGQATPFGEPRVREIMTTTTSFRAHDAKHIWSFGTFPEKDLLGHLGLGDRVRDFHAVLSIALGMNAQGQHRNKSYETSCPIATSMPKMDQLINCDLADVVADATITTYPHKAARKCLPSADVVDDPTATLQVMGKVATMGLKALRKRWLGVDAYLLGDDKATRPALEEGHTKWYDASEGNRKYAAPVNEWPRFDPVKMKPKRSASGKRKKKDTPPPVPLSRFFGAAPPKAKLVLAGSGSRADPFTLPPSPKRSRVEPLEELD